MIFRVLIIFIIPVDCQNDKVVVMTRVEVPLQVKDLHKSYQVSKQRDPSGRFEAVRGISFEVRNGECFGLLGPNGAGKSTTIQCISGFYPATSGEVRVKGFNVYSAPKSARKFMGICPQEDTLDSDFNVLDQMVRHASFYRVPAAEGKLRARALLKRFQLEDKSNDLVESLSGGMRRRLQVARALVSNPEVLVLDEPTTGLDPEVRRILWEVLMEYRQNGLAILLSTHYMEEAERLCDRIGIIHQGKILDIDTPVQLIKRYVPIDTVEEEVKPGVVWRRPPNLEDVYLKITGSQLVKE
jgi:lipooligosaccharide transport system ATP-binding protein